MQNHVLHRHSRRPLAAALLGVLLAVSVGCVKVEAPTDERVLPYGDSGLSLLQVARNLQGSGLAVAMSDRDLTDADRFHATSGIEMTLDCGGQVEPVKIYRFASEAAYDQAVEQIAETEKEHRRNYPGFVFRFAFYKNLLLLFDEVGRDCRPQLVEAFESL